MAVAFITQPLSNTFIASDTPIPYVFSSNQTTQPNFSFVIETLINNQVISTDIVFPEKSNRAHWDASKVTVNAIKPADRTTDLFTYSMLPTLKVRVAERYGTTPVTQTPVTSSVCKLLKASNTDEVSAINPVQYGGWIESMFPGNSVWLTNCPTDENGYQTFNTGRYYPIYATILNGRDDITVWGFTMYNSFGNPFAIYTSAVGPGCDKVSLCLDPSFLNSVAMDNGLSLYETSKIAVQVNNSNDLIVVFVGNLGAVCEEYHQISWLNNLGAYDQFLFTHNRETQLAIESQEYKKQFGRWNADNSFTYDDFTSGDTQYLKTVKPVGTLYSGYISEKYQNWLQEIYYSLDVQLYEQFLRDYVSVTRGTSKIVVTNTNTIFLKERFEDTINFQLDFRKTNWKTLTR